MSRWGDIVQTVTLALLVYELTGSGSGVTAVGGEIVPVLLFAPLAGALIDRLPRVRIMIVCDWHALGSSGYSAWPTTAWRSCAWSRS